VLYREKLCLEVFLIVKSSVQKLGNRRLGDQGLGEWVIIYEILTKALVKQHILYSQDHLLLPKGLLAHSVRGREDAETVRYGCVGKRLTACRALAFFMAAFRTDSVLEAGCCEKGDSFMGRQLTETLENWILGLIPPPSSGVMLGSHSDRFFHRWPIIMCSSL